MELKKLINHRKGYSLADLQGIVLVLVIIAVLFGAGLYVLAEFQDQIASTGGDRTDHLNRSISAVGNTTGSLGDLAEWLPIIIVVIAAAIVIGIVIRSFSAGQVA